MKAAHKLRSFSASVQDDRASVLLAGTKDSNQAQFSRGRFQVKRLVEPTVLSTFQRFHY